MIDSILNYINEKLLGGREADYLSSSDDLLESGLIDSMGMMSLIGFVEDHFSVKIPPEEMTIDNFQSVEAIGRYLEQLKGQ